MIPLDPGNRSGLIHRISEGIKSGVCREAILTGTVVVLGGFHKIPPSTCPGWIVRITSRRGKIWTIALLCDKVRHEYRTMFIESIPWTEWTGKCGTANNMYRGYSIYDGDFPHHAFGKFKEALHADTKTPVDN